MSRFKDKSRLKLLKNEVASLKTKIVSLVNISLKEECSICHFKICQNQKEGVLPLPPDTIFN